MTCNCHAAQTETVQPARTPVIQRACACGGASGAGGRCAECEAREKLGIQPRLTINPPGDRYEQEADRIAEQVVSTDRPTLRGPLPVTPLVQRQETEEEDEELQATPSPLQRQDAEEDEEEELQTKRGALQRQEEEEEEELQAMRGSIQRQPEEEEEEVGQARGAAFMTGVGEEEEEEPIQQKPAGASRGRAARPGFARDLAARSLGGHPLDPETRSFFEPRFGTDLSAVRVHSGVGAASMARSINARAFTHGQHIYFAAGEYAPRSGSGRRLIAHELVHTLQQGGARAPVRANGVQGKAAGAVQRDLALEPTHPNDELVELTPDEIQEAIRFNDRRFGPDDINIIQDVVGTAQTGAMNEETIRLIARLQRDFGETQDGKIGEDTFDLISRIRDAEGAGTAPGDCITSFNIERVFRPRRVAGAAAGTADVESRFNMRARFEPRCGCRRFEYRQFICGNVEMRPAAGGAPTNLNGQFAGIPGGALPACPGFVEDGDTTLPAGTGPNYGHRAQGGDANDRYVPNRANGCEYRGFDVVSLRGISTALFGGDTLRMRIRFRGQIVHTTGGRQTIVARRNWSVRGDVVI